MNTVTVPIYPEIDGEEREFEARARVNLGAPMRYGPNGSPGDPAEVEWIDVAGEGMRLRASEFEAWCERNGAKLELSAYDDQAIELASDDDSDLCALEDHFEAVRERDF